MMGTSVTFLILAMFWFLGAIQDSGLIEFLTVKLLNFKLAKEIKSARIQIIAARGKSRSTNIP